MKTNLPQDIIPARKQPEYPSSLSEKQSDQLRENPTGIIEIVEGKLTEAQLEAIADGLMKLTILYTSFKEELMSRTKARKVTPEKPCPQKPFIQVEGELTEAQLEAIAAGGFAIN